MIYINPKNSEQLKSIANYTTAGGITAVDIVSLFAANYCTNEWPCLRAQNNDPPTKDPFNSSIQQVLIDGSVKFLQDKGIVVLLSVLNGHTDVGWSCFKSDDNAKNFVNYLQSQVIDKY